MRAALSTCIACTLVAMCSLAEAKPSPRIKLVVLVVVDQLGSTYLARYQGAFSGGIEKLKRRGAYYEQAVYAYGNTETGPGHATIVTGAWPNVHGIVANYWFDPVTAARIGCVDDPEHRKSPRNLMAPTITDALALSTEGKSRTIAVGIKDRGAILLAGERPAAAVWYDVAGGRFTSGTWYPRDGEPRWLSAVTLEKNARTAHGSKWTRLRTDVDYDALAGPDDDPTETKLAGVGNTFPRTVGEGLDPESAEWREAYLSTPAPLEAMFALADRAITEEQLGQRGHTDMLALGVSSLDYAGHYWGPRSHEALDILMRIDRHLGELIDRVERTIGAGSTLWVLTSDHGVALTPEEARAMGIRATRVDQRTIVAKLNESFDRASKTPAKTTVLDLNVPRLYLKYGDPRADRLTQQRTAASILAASPGVVEAHAVADLASFAEPWRTLFERTLYPGRVPDVLVLQRAYDLFDWVGPHGGGAGSGHGTPYLYDASVPVLFAGPGVPRTTDRHPVEMTRVAPTIAALLAIAPPAAAFAPPLPFADQSN
jgi:hypothetical protein